MSSPSNEAEQSPSTSSVGLAVVPPTVREIHKNGWLKRLPQNDRRHTPFAKNQKPEKMWIVFCIHDDVEAFLEYYENRRSAFSHRPTISIPLANCLHISPNIVVQESDFVFSVTMESQVIKLAASTREQMSEWIDTLRGKLTELGVLNPPNNLYSRCPEVKPVLAPNRDPTSPLPPPPAVITSIPVGTEPPAHRISQIPRSLETSNMYSELPTSQQRPSSSTVINSSSRTTATTSVQVLHSPSTPPLPSIRRESENRTTAGQSGIMSEASTTVSPTTSITALNDCTTVTNCTSRNDLPDVAASHNSLPDHNGNSSNTDIYEPLCLASTPSPSHVGLPPTFVHRPACLRSVNQGRRAPRIANEIVRNPLSPRAHSEDRNVNLVHHGEQNNNSTVMTVIGGEQDAENSRPMSLKEKQVFQLSCEMKHKAGVRLHLPKKDCVNSIAFAEYLGNLWITGWKQKDHPLLYHNFHIGDRVVSVAGHHVSTTHDFNRALKTESSPMIEFVIARLPFGKAIAIRREIEGQDLGIIREGNTAEIVEVCENGVASRHGLPPKAKSTASNTDCNWMLTEINGRSLNLFFKDCEIQDRLNAVGRDISILVQPSDFVKVLKKQLRATWNYKDYIVQ